MYALDQQDGAFGQFQPLSVEFPHPGHEVVFRNLHLLPGEQLEYVALEIVVVHRVEVVEIVASVRQLGRIEAVYEIVVCGEGQRMQAAGLELYAQTFAESGLAAAGRSGNQHYPDWVLPVAAAVDFFGNLDYLLLLKGFGHENQVGGPALLAGEVHVAHVAELHDAVPAYGFGEDLEGLGLFVERRETVGVVPVGHAQNHAVAVGRELPYPQIAGAGHERAAVEVRSLAESVVFDVDVAAGLHELHLVELAEAAEQLRGLLHLDIMPPERQVELHQLRHPVPDGGDVLFAESGAVRFGDAAEVALRDRTAQHCPASGENVFRCLAEQEAERMAVDVATCVAPVVGELYVLVVEHFEKQSFGDVVDLCGEYVAGFVEVERREHFEQGGTFGKFLEGAGIPAVDSWHCRWKIALQKYGKIYYLY